MRLYAGIDLHANNNYLAVIDETDELVEAKRIYRNDIEIGTAEHSSRTDRSNGRHRRRVDLQLVLAGRRARSRPATPYTSSTPWPPSSTRV